MSLRAEDVGVRAGGCFLIRHVSLEVRRGELLAIMGPNGAGKSTLLNALSGSLPAAEGRVLFEGKPLPDWGADALARQRAVLAQAVELHFPFNVREVVALGRLPHGQAERESIDEALQLVGLTGLAKRSYLTLSGGERQRVHLARALAQVWPTESATGLRVLLLDEPTNNLDPHHQHDILTLARRWAEEGAAVAAILHDWNLALRFAHRAVILQRGEVAVPPSPVAEALTADNLERVFGLRLQALRGESGETWIAPRA
ncbi:MAG: heme ABC transporter ATP-binding protein [Verrucomicrobiota bacterium JB022]|nr:heme ABC transporter ATP-binding protein [Verrucomicrobiota bacterium JB022]